MKTRIVFATTNEGKMKEIRRILDDLPYEIVSLREAGMEVDVEENEATFEGNALLKAKAIAKLCPESIVLADDSGLEIDYLDGAPGVYSARYMGENTSYQVKNNALIKQLEGVSIEQRTARFVCVIAAVWPDGRVSTAHGVMEGYIGYEERGKGGFGYDPIFMLPAYGCSSAELSLDDKNAISHRGKALSLMKGQLRS